ncbi:MAG: LuxR C-terminal-related transcriptional regulator [Bifidobacteriaceae bacterium]|nr:LuxR C-terminal-related transcriptional regulator [Bifidobacteriaceae bacterium]
MRKPKWPLTTARQYLLLTGYSVFLAVTATLLWGGYVPFLRRYLAGDDLIVLDFFARAFALPAALIVTALVVHRRGDGDGKLPRLLPFIFLGASAAVFAGVGFFGWAGEPLAVAIGLGCGIGCGLLFILFQRLLATQAIFAAGFIVIVAALVSPLLHFLLGLMPEGYALLANFLVLVPLCALPLFLSRRDMPSAGRTPSRTPPAGDLGSGRSARREAARILVTPLLGIALSAFVIGLMQVTVVWDGDTRIINTAKMLGMLGSGIVLCFTWLLTYPRFSPESIYRTVFPLTATAYLLLPFMSSSYFYAFVVVSFLIFAVVSALMVITCLQVSRDLGLRPMVVYGGFAGVVYLVAALGSVVGYVFLGIGGAKLTQLLVIALVAVYILAFALILMLRKRSDKTGQSREPSVLPEPAAPTSADLFERFRERYALSERETETAILLANGRDVPTIARKLFISENTVRTHTKSLYRKLDVHTKQDFLDLLDQAGAPQSRSLPGAVQPD